MDGSSLILVGGLWEVPALSISTCLLTLADLILIAGKNLATQDGTGTPCSRIIGSSIR